MKQQQGLLADYSKIKFTKYVLIASTPDLCIIE